MPMMHMKLVNVNCCNSMSNQINYDLIGNAKGKLLTGILKFGWITWIKSCEI